MARLLNIYMTSLHFINHADPLGPWTTLFSIFKEFIPDQATDHLVISYLKVWNSLPADSQFIPTLSCCKNQLLLLFLALYEVCVYVHECLCLCVFNVYLYQCPNLFFFLKTSCHSIKHFDLLLCETVLYKINLT